MRKINQNQPREQKVKAGVTLAIFIPLKVRNS